VRQAQVGEEVLHLGARQQVELGAQFHGNAARPERECERAGLRIGAEQHGCLSRQGKLTGSQQTRNLGGYKPRLVGIVRGRVQTRRRSSRVGGPRCWSLGQRRDERIRKRNDSARRAVVLLQHQHLRARERLWELDE